MAAVFASPESSIISYEEYHPYGSTAWWAGSSALVSQKRYRFTGMERDDETGLQCHGVRYYAVWLGRWVSADPIGLGDGVNRFGYCHDSPLAAADATGMLTEESTKSPAEVPGTTTVINPSGAVEHLTPQQLDARANALLNKIAQGNTSFLIPGLPGGRALGQKFVRGQDGKPIVVEMTAAETQQFAVATLDSLDRIAHTGVGLSALEALARSPRDIVLAGSDLSPDTRQNNRGMIGAESLVVAFNPNLLPAQVGSASWWNEPELPTIALFHELLHAFRAATRTSANREHPSSLDKITELYVDELQPLIPGFLPQKTYQSTQVGWEEYQVTGLGTFSAGFFTENRFRAEIGASYRETYSR